MTYQPSKHQITPTHIIFSQNKNIGDVVLTLPSAALVKERWPDCRVSLLCQQYTQPVAIQCPYIDNIVDWTALCQQDDATIIAALQALHIDVVVHMASDRRIARVAYLAGIPTRIGSGQKWYHWRYANRRINQARRHARQHELQLNAALLAPLGFDEQYSRLALIKKMQLLPPDAPLPASLQQQVQQTKKPLVILHPGSHGHGREWPQQHFIDLVQRLATTYTVIFTGSNKEADRFKTLVGKCDKAIDTMGQLSLSQLMTLISKSTILVSSGTGPAHLAAAMGTNTITLFPPRNGISPRRWSPPGEQAITLMHRRIGPCLGCKDDGSCRCMAKLTPEKVLRHIPNVTGNANIERRESSYL